MIHVAWICNKKKCVGVRERTEEIWTKARPFPLRTATVRLHFRDGDYRGQEMPARDTRHGVVVGGLYWMSHGNDGVPLRSLLRKLKSILLIFQEVVHLLFFVPVASAACFGSSSSSSGSNRARWRISVVPYFHSPMVFLTLLLLFVFSICCKESGSSSTRLMLLPRHSSSALFQLNMQTIRGKKFLSLLVTHAGNRNRIPRDSHKQSAETGTSSYGICGWGIIEGGGRDKLSNRRLFYIPGVCLV